MILYLVLFFPGAVILDTVTADVIIFSAVGELARIFTYTIPALALIWYLILEKKSVPVSFRRLRVKKTDLPALAWSFPGLLLIGVGLSFAAARFAPYSAAPVIEPPVNAAGWVIVAFSCFFTGYLEESFFRFYLLKKLENSVPFAPLRVVFAVLLFAICHSYEGVWGIANAALAGLLLSVLFEKYKSLHGIAWGHALYNVFVYVMASFFV